MCTISKNVSSKSIIKYIKFKLNEKQCIKTGNPTHCWAGNNGRLVRLFNPLWEERTRGHTAAASWAVTRRTPGALSSCEFETPYLLKEEYRDNVNSGTYWVGKFLVVVISSIYNMGFDLAGYAFFSPRDRTTNR